MKLFNCVVKTGVLAAALASGVMAESPEMIKAKVPFAFKIGAETFAPGEYTVQRTGNDATLMIRNANRGATFLSTPGGNPNSASVGSALTFERHDGQLFLSQVQMAGQQSRLVHTKAVPVSSANTVAAMR